jgi:hypothetical protein
MKRPTRTVVVLVLGAVTALSVARLMPAAAAQGTRDPAAAERELAAVMLDETDLPGYRRTDVTVPDDFADSGAVAARQVSFQVDPGSDRLRGEMILYAYFFAAIPAAQAFLLDEVELFGSEAPLSLPGADEGVVFFTPAAGQTGTGNALAGWRRGVVVFEVLVALSPADQAAAELRRLAALQNDKAVRGGPFGAQPAAPTPAASPRRGPTPAATPTPTAGTTGAPLADALVILAVRVGGALARDNTVVKAFVDGMECASRETVLGWTFFAVASQDTRPGCGRPGATVSFTVDGVPARETIPWPLDRIATMKEINVEGAVRPSGRLVRPLVSERCLPAKETGAPCTPAEQRLWDGAIAAWEAELAGGSAEALALAWLGFRGARGEMLSSLVRAGLTGQPFTFIAVVRYEGGADEPDPYIALLNFGADRDVAGWRLRTEGGEYVFPPGAVLPAGSFCRVYLTAEAAALDTESACAGAVLVQTGAGPLLGSRNFAELVDRSETVVDEVAWGG